MSRQQTKTTGPSKAFGVKKTGVDLSRKKDHATALEDNNDLAADAVPLGSDFKKVTME